MAFSVHVVVLVVSDLERAIAFYERTVSRDAVDRREGYAYVKVASGVRLALCPEATATAVFGSASFGRVALAFNVPRPDDVDRCAAAAETAGGRVISAPRARSNGGRVATVSDPDGHVFEIAFGPKTTFDGYGRVEAID